MSEEKHALATSTTSWWKAGIGLIEGKIAFKTALAASISLLLGVGFSEITDRPDILISGLWCVMAAIVVMQAHLGGTYQAAWVRFLGVLIGSIAGAFFASTIGNDALSLGVSVFFTIVICALLKIKESFRIASLSTAVIVIQAALIPTTSPWMFSFLRFIDSCIGILTALCVAQLIWPEKAIENLRQNIIKILAMSSKYYLLAVNLEPESEMHMQASESLFSEIEEFLQQNYAYTEEAKHEIFYPIEQSNNWQLINNQLEIIIESVSSLRNIHKEPLTKIFDDSLANHVANVVDQTAVSFQTLEKMLLNEEPMASFEKLNQSLIALNNDLVRFGATRTTRKFNLEEVESFFVFFYSLRSIGEAIKKMGEHIRELSTSSLFKEAD